MCGIAGILLRDEAQTVAREELVAMGHAIAHRGPDAAGVWIDGPCGMIHRRLSIIDLAGGDQPIGNEDGSVQVVFNGEIYNYRELRRDLEWRGHRFATNSDTETLVHLYEEHGEQLVDHLRGMFAFALWDARRRRLVLARDRIGLKPLYLYRDGRRVLFGSELKAILAAADVDRAIDPAGVDAYLALGFIPGARSIFRRVEKLPAAHIVCLGPDRLDETPRRYWRLALEPDESRSLAEWREALDEKLRETVAAHQIADVPVGAFLSGGVDSSAMVWLQSRQARCDRLPTFSIGFHEQSFDERPFAREVAEWCGTEHHAETITPEAVGSLEDLITHYDEPFADSSAIPTMHLARLARRRVKVVISGDGGDEAFGGYARYAHDLREWGWRNWLPAWLRRWGVGPVAAWWPKADWLPRPLRWKTTLTNLAMSPDRAYANTLLMCRQPFRSRLLAPDLQQALAGACPEEAVAAAYRRAPAGEPLTAMTATDIDVLLPDDFLVKVDRASMACGLEVRPPLVDHELLELAMRVPTRWKVRQGEGKWIFRELFRERLPTNVTRRRKQGFEIPVDHWLRGPLRDAFESAVLAPTHRGVDLVDRTAARRLYDSHLSGRGRHGQVLWSLLVLGCWAERYLAPTCDAAAVITDKVTCGVERGE